MWNEINRDDCWGMAARLSFYFLLALFPFLIFLSALIGFIPLEPGLLGRILLEMQGFLPERTYSWLQDFTIDLVNSRDSGVVSIGLLLALWWASVGFRGMVGVFNRALAVQETRPYFKVQLVVVGVTILVSVFVITSGVLLFLGDWLIQLLVQRITVTPYPSFQAHLQNIYSASRWILIFAFLNIGMQIVYCSLPAQSLPWTLLSPGSAIASLCWIFGSRSFAFFVNRFVGFETYQKLYGSLAALILLMIWLYLSSLFILLGGEINSEIFRLRKARISHTRSTASTQ
ncbi:YihY/virulence factor BrkB family protein [Acidobacteria bacterium AH-259-D05]|nr:YihY/virulence factor BrkB family protein [Acidobacteria bacterium AH-259-D05]